MATQSTPLMFQPLVKFFDFNGRARRSEYWLFYLFQFGVGFALAIIGSFGPLKTAMDAVSALFWLAMLIPNISVGVRRFHDTNRTGWWTAFQFVVLIVAAIVFVLVNGASFAAGMNEVDWQAIESGDGTAALDMFQHFGPFALWVILPWWLATIVTLVFHVLDGTRGANRFGADPKGAATDASVF